MRIGIIKGTVTATVKATGLAGKRMMIVDLIDADGKITDAATVAIDTCGAGPGETVLVASGSAARVLTDTSGLPIDATIVAVVDSVDLAKPAPARSKKQTGQKPSQKKKSSQKKSAGKKKTVAKKKRQ